MRQSNKLSGAKVRTADAGKYGDGGGLCLHKRDARQGKWVLLVTVHGRRREMGLGAYPGVSLKEAREEAAKWRAVVRRNLDSIIEREWERRQAERNLNLLKDIAIDAFETRKAELKGDGKAGRGILPWSCTFCRSWARFLSPTLTRSI